MVILYRVNSPYLTTDWHIWQRYKSPMLRDSALDTLRERIKRARSFIDVRAG